MKNLLIYGANGYTGELIAREAVKRGLKPMLCGRSKTRVEPLANELGLVHRTFSLEDKTSLDYTLKQVDLVIHCAGPFSLTSKQMVEGCLRTKTHYIDITGEIAVFEMLAGYDRAAKDSGIMILPGAGFDVVPTDCLAKFLSTKLPGATAITLAFYGGGEMSHGTRRTMTINLGKGGAIRKDGKITHVPAAWETKRINFGNFSKDAVTIPWGDVSTAFYSTGIPNIKVFTVVPKQSIRLLHLTNYFGWLLSTKPIQNYLLKQIPNGGPDFEAREQGNTYVWACAENEEGDVVEAVLTGPEGYKFTYLSVMEITSRILNDEFSPGFQTPSNAYGAGLVLAIEGVRRELRNTGKRKTKHEPQ
ncbi:MAG: saccharopine dehydrogenase family protein [Pyrinomonadaceae bacterium]